MTASSKLDALCLAAATAGKVVLWDGGAVVTIVPRPMTQEQRDRIDAAIARSKQARVAT